MHALVDKATIEFEAALKSFTAILHSAEVDSSPSLSLDRDLSDVDIRETVNSLIAQMQNPPVGTKNALTHFVKNIEFGSPSPGLIQIKHVVPSATVAITGAALDVGVKASLITREKCKHRFVLAIEEANTRAELLRVEAEKLNNAQTGLWSLNVGMKVALVQWRSNSFMRLVFVGLFVPVFVFTVAMAHLGGQLGIAHLPSIFSLVPKVETHPKRPLPQSTPLASASTKG